MRGFTVFFSSFSHIRYLRVTRGTLHALKSVRIICTRFALGFLRLWIMITLSWSSFHLTVESNLTNWTHVCLGLTFVRCAIQKNSSRIKRTSMATSCFPALRVCYMALLRVLIALSDWPE